MEPCDLRARARRRYEWGRVRFAAPYGVAAIAVVAVGGSIAPLHAPSVALGVVLVIVCLVLPFLSRRLGHHVPAGLLAGSVPMVAALASLRAQGCAAQCDPWCAPLCAVAGIAVGAWLSRTRVAWPALLVAALTAAVGCFAVGAGTLVGTLVGIAAGSVPALALRRT